jgi:hypothetical protein
MVRPTRQPGDLPEVFDHYFVMFPTRYATCIPSKPRMQSSASPAFGVLPTTGGGNVVWAVR